jgi:hypothetical protein
MRNGTRIAILAFVVTLANAAYGDDITVTFSSQANSISVATDPSNNPENPGFAGVNPQDPFSVVLQYSGGTQNGQNWLLSGASVMTYWNGVLDSTLSMTSADASILLSITGASVTLNACAPDANGCSGSASDLPGFGDQFILDGAGLTGLNSLTASVWQGLTFDSNGQLTVTAFNADGSESQIIGSGGSVSASSASTGVPEPSSLLLLLSGGIATTLFRRFGRHLRVSL